MLERMVRDAPDHALNKINALDLAKREGIDEERVIAALLNAVGLGMFEMTWNVMCPSCVMLPRTWMPGTRLRQGFAGPARLSRRSLSKTGQGRATPPFLARALFGGCVF